MTNRDKFFKINFCWGGINMSIDAIIDQINQKRELLKLKYFTIQKYLNIYSCSFLMALSLGSIGLFEHIQSLKNEFRIELESTINHSLEEKSTEILAISNPTTEQKVNLILQRDNLSEDMLDTIVSIILIKSETKNYDEAYQIIDSLYNRTQDARLIQKINSILGSNYGNNLYHQSIALDGFEIYSSGLYKQYLNENLKSSPTYQACVDFLYIKNLLETNSELEDEEIIIEEGSDTQSSIPAGLEEKIMVEMQKNYSHELEILKIALGNSPDESNFFAREIPLDEKIQYILTKYGLTEEEFNILTSIILAEARPYDLESEENYIYSYLDAYATTNTIYNRIHSITWSTYIDSIMGEGLGTNPYYQSICNGQFSVYASGDYQKYLDMDKTELPGYQAAIDMLYTENIIHNRLNFVASFYFDHLDESSKEKACQKRTHFVPNGNWYGGELSEEDVLVLDEIKVFHK